MKREGTTAGHGPDRAEAPRKPALGARLIGEGRCHFRVWAPRAGRVEVRLLGASERLVPLKPGSHGYHEGTVGEVPQQARYFYRLDGRLDRPDPASRSQPEGVHGPSQVFDPGAFAWGDGAWTGPGLERCVFYELHVGTFTPEGTFDAIVPHLDRLAALGVTVIELMPLSQFPGGRNWGYDGVFPYAVQETYGGPEGLQRLVAACHRRGLGVALDVVYNHIGPEGNVLGDFGDYFSERYRTPWGPAMNFDGPGSDEVRLYFIGNALYWIDEFRIDALRVDAIHGIVDPTARPFLAELTGAVHRRAAELGRSVQVIAESSLNDVRVVWPSERGGLGFDGQWNDDFHHSLHVLLTGETSGYYQDFGEVSQMAKAISEGFVLSGQYSGYRRRRHGVPSRAVPGGQLVVFAQNHDQVGNRLAGDRLSALISFEALKLAAGVVLLSPFVPLLFMGEEYGETSPFQYFVSHTDPDLVEAVRRGRRSEFASFRWEGKVPDPQAESTFLASKLDHGLRESGHHRLLVELHAELLRVRRELPTLRRLSKDETEVRAFERERALWVRRGPDGEGALALFNFARERRSLPAPLGDRVWRLRIDSAGELWGGPGNSLSDLVDGTTARTLPLQPLSFVLLTE